MPRPRKSKPDWRHLKRLINEYEAAGRVDEMKGGGDPADYEAKGLRFESIQRRLRLYLQLMQEFYEDKLG